MIVNGLTVCSWGDIPKVIVALLFQFMNERSRSNRLEGGKSNHATHILDTNHVLCNDNFIDPIWP